MLLFRIVSFSESLHEDIVLCVGMGGGGAFMRLSISNSNNLSLLGIHTVTGAWPLSAKKAPFPISLLYSYQLYTYTIPKYKLCTNRHKFIGISRCYVLKISSTGLRL